MVITKDTAHNHWAFYFQSSGLLFFFTGTWSHSVNKVCAALQELQASALMLYRMAFHLSGKVVAFHLDKSTFEVSLFF